MLHFTAVTIYTCVSLLLSDCITTHTRTPTHQTRLAYGAGRLRLPFTLLHHGPVYTFTHRTRHWVIPLRFWPFDSNQTVRNS